MLYQKRVIEKKLEEYLKFFPIIGITGPRQSGKSTLLLKMLANYEYLTFDDYRNVDSFYTDPEKVHAYSCK